MAFNQDDFRRYAHLEVLSYLDPIPSLNVS